MIQILSLRNGEAWFERGMRAASVEEIFSNPLPLIKDKTEPSERWNMYYTVADCLEEKGRKLSVQHHIPIDIDGIDVPDTDLTVHLEGIARVVCKTLGVKYEETGVLFSGHGLQLIIGTTNAITDPGYFKSSRKFYKAICDNINLDLVKAGLKGSADPAVWSAARLMRYPGTMNIKPDKPERLSRIIQGNIVRVDFTVEKASRIPLLNSSDYVNSSVVATYPTPDVKTIMSECEFLKWAQTFPEKVNEPQWYASLSLTSRFPEGREFSHKISQGHSGYSFAETEVKINQALENAGPRTCANIDTLSDKCKGCKHYQKLATPLLIEGPDYIKTKNSGFYDIVIGENGEPRRGKPNYHDLYKQFSKDYHYKVTHEGMFWKWIGSHYEVMQQTYVHQYAELKFDPKPNSNMRREFVQKVRLYNVVDTDWFMESTLGKMNFQNGVFDLATKQLLPVASDFGFRTTLPCEYQPSAEAPRFMKFIEDVTCSRPELAAILQEFVGYIFAGTTCKFDKILMLLGEGENGKSTFVKVIRALADRGCSNLSIKSLHNDQNRALLEGKLVNIAEENSKDSFRDTELIKNIASGGVISVKRVYVEPYEFTNTAKVVMLCNELPKSFDSTHGFFRKLLLVPFDAVFSRDLGNRDNDLIDRLLTELPGIFNWALQGYERLVKNGGFTESADSKKAMYEYRQETNPLLAWFDEACEVSRDARHEVNRQELYDDYSQWCQRNGEKYVASSKSFCNFLRIRIKGAIGKEPVERKRQQQQQSGMRTWTMSNLIFNGKAEF